LSGPIISHFRSRGQRQF